jgi:hypothetical protein
MRKRVRALLPASDAENYKRLSEYFNIPVEHLEERLPYLHWEAQGRCLWLEKTLATCS